MEKVSTGERLKEYMQINDMRQVDILNKCRPYIRKMGITITKSMISQYISGRCDPGKDKILVLAKALNVSEEWLSGYDAPMERSAKSQNAESAILVANLAKDRELLERVEKISQLNGSDKSKVYGYIDAIYEISALANEGVTQDNGTENKK